MKKTLALLLSAALLALSLASCAQATAQSVSAPQSDSSAQPQAMTAERQPTALSFGYATYGGGMLHNAKGVMYQSYFRYNRTPDGFDVFIRQYDTTTDEISFLCRKQGCTHTDNTCQAYREQSMMVQFVLPDYLVEFKSPTDLNKKPIQPELWITDYETAESKKLPLDCSFVEFPYNYMAIRSESNIAWDEQFCYATASFAAMESDTGATKQQANYVMRVNLQTGICEPVYNGENNRCWLMGVLGNSLVMAHWQGNRTAMRSDPTDPNTVFCEIITLPLDGSPETVHHTMPDGSETFCYDEKTHAFYFIPYKTGSGNESGFSTDGIIYKQDLLTDTITKLARLPDMNENTEQSIGRLWLADGHLLIQQYVGETSKLYAVALADGGVQEITLQNPAHPEYSFFPEQLTADTFWIGDYEATVYVLRAADLWANKAEFIPKPGLREFCKNGE